MIKVAYQIGVDMAIKEASTRRVYTNLLSALGGGVAGAGIGALVPDADYKTMLLGGLGGTATGVFGSQLLHHLKGQQVRQALREAYEASEDIARQLSI